MFRVTRPFLNLLIKHKRFFWNKYIILCILKGKSPFKMHNIIFFSRKKYEKKIYVCLPYLKISDPLPETHLFLSDPLPETHLFLFGLRKYKRQKLTLLPLPARISYGLPSSKCCISFLLLHCISIVIMSPSTLIFIDPLHLAMHFLSNTQHPVEKDRRLMVVHASVAVC